MFLLCTVVVLVCTWYVLVHTCFCFWALLSSYKTRLAGVAATSMRSTRGCGCMDVASLAWVAWQSRRLRIGSAKRPTSVWRRLVMAARMMVPENGWNEVWVGVVWACTRTNIVCTLLPKYVPSTYYFPRVRTRYIMVCNVFTKILQWTLFCVVCLWETILCVRDMYAVVLQDWISAPIGVQHTWH
jgi:hypothetical protein